MPESEALSNGENQWSARDLQLIRNLTPIILVTLFRVAFIQDIVITLLPIP